MDDAMAAPTTSAPNTPKACQQQLTVRRRCICCHLSAKDIPSQAHHPVIMSALNTPQGPEFNTWSEELISYGHPFPRLLRMLRRPPRATLRFARGHTSVVSCTVEAPKDGSETLGTEMLGGEGTDGSEGALETAGSTAF